MSNRPNYILELKDGRTIEFVHVPHSSQAFPLWLCNGRCWNENDLKALGATPVPQPKPKMVWQLVKFWIQGDSPDWANNHKMGFASIEDAENYRRRCESIGPEWTDWEPKEEEQCWYVGQTCDIVTTGYVASVFGDDLLRGRLHPTKERAQEWLAKYGKAWGLM